jgi:long-chain acyl-CoA synthetase
MHGTLDWVVDRAAAVHGARPAVVDGAIRRTYAEVARRVRGLGAGLAGLGLAPGDVVASLQLNSAEHLECWLGLPYHGYVLNDLNLRLAVPELVFMLEDCASAALVVDPAHLDLGRRLRDACPSVRHLVATGPRPVGDDVAWWEDLVGAEEQAAPALDGSTVASISYTGGTTGRPKGVVLSHANLVENAKHVLIAMGHRTSDRYLHAAPMFHSGDGLHTYATTWVGATHVIVPAFDPDLVTRVVETEKVTLTVWVPTMVNMIVNHPATPERDLSSLRFVLYGASPMPAALQRRAMELIPAEWAQGYGLTEAAPLVSFLSPEDHLLGLKGQEPHATRLASAGTPVVGVQAEVRRPDGTRADPDEAGEIWVRGPNVMVGYWNRPEETAGALTSDGWLRTGDVARADNDGYLYIVDRLHDVIITGGENVYSTEVENALYAHPAVLEAAVIAVPDDTWGERVHAIVVLRPGEAATKRDLVAHCRGLLAGFKVPRSVELRTEPLAKSGAGKIAKQVLRQPFWEGHDRQVH